MPTKLGRYEIQGELGSGAMGIVYRAEDPRLGRPVALKTTNAEVAGNPDLLQTFLPRGAGGCQAHPPQHRYHLRDRRSEWSAVHCHGVSRRASIQKVIADRSDIPILKKVQIVIDTCKGLDYAHQHGIVHRDVKPGNIVVLNNGQVKIVDFGIARVGVSSMTRTGVVLGTVMYMSPEQVQGQTVDARSDVFPLACALRTSYLPDAVSGRRCALDSSTRFSTNLRKPSQNAFRSVPHLWSRLYNALWRRIARNATSPPRIWRSTFSGSPTT